MSQALDAVFPHGIPVDFELTDAMLLKQVIDWLIEDCRKRQIRWVPISDNLILLAAGRASEHAL